MSSRKHRGRHLSTNTRFWAELCERRVLLSGNIGFPGSPSLTTDPTGVSSVLLSLASAGVSAEANIPSDIPLVFDSSGRVEVRITAVDVAALEAPLAAIGFDAVGSAPADHLLEGFIPLSALPTIDSLTSEGLMGVQPDYRAYTKAGKIDSEGDSILEADRTRAATGNAGAGVTVGVLSDSYNNLGTASTDVKTGDLPANVNILQDYPGGGTDEGRAILQIVHDLAPGSDLAFATGAISETGFAQNILNLAAPVNAPGAGATVICDDLGYDDEPYFQDGVVAQAINTVEANSNVAYFSADGNDDTQSYESSNVNFYSATISGINPAAEQYYNFNPTGTAADSESLTLQSGQGVDIALEWDQPYYTTTGVTTNLNLFLLNSSNTVVESATTNTISAQEPFQDLQFENETGGSANYSLVIEKASGTTPARIKYVNQNDGDDVQFNNYFTYSDTITGHPAALGALAVAAAPASSQRTTEPYTSEGPVTILFNSTGGRMTIPQVRAKPDITAIDGVSTTFFYGSNGYNGTPMFYGTSAATPHAAAVAALIRAANPSWTPTQIYADLKSTADPNIVTEDPNFTGQNDNVNFSGTGLIDAYRAVVGAAVPAVATVSDGFESGALQQDWTTYNSGAGKTEVESGYAPASGTYQLVEGGITDNHAFAVLCEAILNLNVPSYASNISLNFSQKKFYNASYASKELDYAMPATFTGHGNYEGVALSVNGTNWYSLLSLTGSNSTTSYQSHSINLSTFAASNGITLGPSTLIKFQYYNAYSFEPTDGGFAFDNVSTTAAVNLTGPAFYLRLDADQVHVDVWNSNSATGSIYAQLLVAQITSLTVSTTGSPQSLTVDFSNGTPYAAGIAYNASGTASSNQLLAVGTIAGADSVTASAGNLTVNGTSLTSSDVGMVSFAPGMGVDSLAVNSGTLTLAQRTGPGIIVDLFSSISTAIGTKLAVAPPLAHATRTVVDTSLLTLAGSFGQWSSTVDLNANDLVVTGGILNTINNQVAQGFAGGTWTGLGIESSAAATDSTHHSALGAILNSNGSGPLYTVFDNVSPGAASVLVKYTYYGDSTLDGKVDGSDYSRVDPGFLSASSTNPSTGWFNGDYNYDNVINGSDYTLIDSVYNTQGNPMALVAPATTTFSTARIEPAAVPSNLNQAGLTASSSDDLERKKDRLRSIFDVNAGDELN